MTMIRNPRAEETPEKWAEYVAWQQACIDKIDDKGVWVLPNAGIFVDIDKANKAYDVTFIDMDRTAPLGIPDSVWPKMKRTVTMKRKQVTPTMIAVFTDMGWSPNIFHLDKAMFKVVESALRLDSGRLEVGGIVKIRRQNGDENLYMWQTVFAGLMKHMGTAADLFKTTYGDDAKLIKF
jgi:hypothetical protein